MQDYTFRPWQEGDDLQLLQLWKDAEDPQQEAFRGLLTADNEGESFSRTLVAEHQGIPVAAGTVYESSLHNRHLWVYVEVAEDHRRQGLGSELLRRLRAAASEAPSGVKSLRAKVISDSGGRQFASAQGFETVQHIDTVRVEAGGVPPVPLRVDEDDRPTQAVEDSATGSVELTQAFWEFYRRSHQWDPPAEQSIGRVNRIFLSDEAYGALVLRDGIQEAQKTGKKAPIVAFAVSYRPMQADMPGFKMPEDHATEVVLGYDFDYAGAREAIMQLLSLLVAQYPVTIEVQESMADLQTMMNPLVKMGSAKVLHRSEVMVSEQ